MSTVVVIRVTERAASSSTRRWQTFEHDVEINDIRMRPALVAELLSSGAESAEVKNPGLIVAECLADDFQHMFEQIDAIVTRAKARLQSIILGQVAVSAMVELPR